MAMTNPPTGMHFKKMRSRQVLVFCDIHVPANVVSGRPKSSFKDQH